MLEHYQDLSTCILMKDFFYSSTKQNKLIQNMVFEYVDDSLEHLIERNVIAQTKIKESDIKVNDFATLEIHVPTFNWFIMDS